MTFIVPEYENNKECVIVARTTIPGNVIQLEFIDFETEESDACVFDSLRLYAGERDSKYVALTTGGCMCSKYVELTTGGCICSKYVELTTG